MDAGPRSRPSKRRRCVSSSSGRRRRREAGAGGDEGEAAAAAALERLASETAWDFCLPALLGPDAGGGGSPEERRRLARAACRALRCCASLGGPPLAEGLAREALRAGQGPERASAEVLAAVAPWLEEPELLGQAVAAALRLLREEEEGEEEEEEAEEARALLVAGRLLPALGSHAAAQGRVWEGLVLPPPETPRRLSRTLLALSALSSGAALPGAGAEGEAVAPPPFEARRCGHFWRVVQEGLAESGDALCRKRARYLLKRAVDDSGKLRWEGRCSPDPGNGPCLFWWCVDKNEQLTEFWENYILIMETLEGNQIHVIKPVLPKLNSLYEHAISEQKDCWVIHPSWLMCIYKRMFESENKTLAKEGIFHFLEIWQTKHLPMSPGFSEFVIGPLMDALSESSFYSRDPGQITGTCPPLGIKLQTFLTAFFTNLPEQEKGIFLLKFIQKMSKRHWCAVPILFFSMALSNIPPCRALDAEGLLALRDVLQCTMITHQILLRGAAQCYLLKAAMHLIDAEKVSLSDIANFIVSLRADESLGRGTTLWEEQFTRRQNRINYLCTISCGRLSANTSCSKLVCAERVDLKCLLSPLLDVLLKLGTNPYISLLKTDKSLQLLLKLLQMRTIKCSSPQVDGITTFLQKALLPAVGSILDFFLRRLTARELNKISDLQHCNLYLDVLSEIMTFCSVTGWKLEPSISSFISSLISASFCNLQEMSSEEDKTLEEQIQKVVSMASLSVVCEIIRQKPALHLESLPSVDILKKTISCSQLNPVLKKPCCMERNGSHEEPASHQGWGKVVARYIHDLWACLRFVMSSSPSQSKDKNLEQCLPDVQRSTKIFQSALEALTVLPSDHILPVLHCMKIMTSKLMESSESLCLQAFDLAWKIVVSLCNTQLIFWPNLKAFVQFVFDPKILTAAAKKKTQVYTKINEIMFQMIEMSSTKTGVFNVLLTYCCQSWLCPSPTDTTAAEDTFLNALNYSDLLIEACLFGTVFRRDQRLIQEVCAFVEDLGSECAANVVTESVNRDDHYVRVCAIKFLCLLDESNTLHKKFIEDFVNKLLDKGELMSKSKIHYVNSSQHRIKNRLWQTLLVLFPKLHEDFLTRTIDRILQAGCSNNQASVKYLIEWNIIMILHKFPCFLPKFWDCFNFVSNESYRVNV
ncbi:hypothetical protein JRQ81_009978 [Phrynocephalus forsythii]|uniref:TARBP1 domain-containing protein n=1 Tax=Phrynocephalus forsythii TaxID=171643 RepID=A0A9Q1B7N0_9SAUR|nr:hypothetical protein JRQ81_009978 [Phrynocephalus forsythii]